MGVVRKQSLYITFIVYLGTAIGAFNVLHLFPVYFSPEQFGLTRVLFAGASTFMQLASFGIPAVMIKFFPYYNDRLDKKQNDFLFLSLVVPIVGFIIISSIVWLLQDKAIAVYEKKSPLVAQHFGLLFVFSFFYLLHRVLETYLSIVFKNIVPTLIRELVIRVYHLVLIGAFVFSLATFEQFMNLYVLTYLVGTILLVAYLIFLKRWHIIPKISPVTKRIKNNAFRYGGFLYGGGLFIILAENIDTMLIAGISGLTSTAVFVVAQYITTFMRVPQQSMNTVIAPMIAQAWKDKDLPQIDKLYKKTAVTQLCIGIFMFLCIWLSIDFVFQLLPSVYAEGKNVILLMGLARIIDQGMGINGELLNTSKYWRVSFTADALLVALSIPLNYFLIKHFGIIGSAVANLVAYTLFNFFRFGFVWKKFGMQPFGVKQILPLLLGAGMFMFAPLLPDWGHIFANIAFRTLLVIVVFGGVMILFNVSEDINTFVAQLKNRFLKK